MTEPIAPERISSPAPASVPPDKTNEETGSQPAPETRMVDWEPTTEEEHLALQLIRTLDATR